MFPIIYISSTTGPLIYLLLKFHNPPIVKPPISLFKYNIAELRGEVTYIHTDPSLLIKLHCLLTC